MSVRTHLFSGLAAVAIVAPAAPAHAQEQTYSFDIPAQDLGGALRAVASRTRAQVIFDGEAIRGKRSKALRGSHTVDTALAILLRGSGMMVRRNSDGVFVVSKASQAVAGREASSAGEGDEAVLASQNRGISEILVIGSNSQNVDIRRTEDDVQPYIVISGEELRKANTQDLDQFLRTRVPQNSQPFDQASLGSNLVGNITLRGLGIDETLVLIDGRRVASGGTTFTQANINGIPIDAIERIEILPASAGAIYGGSAVGGVVNVILRRDYRGLEASLQYGNTFDWTTGDFRGTLSGAFNVAGASVTFTASHTRTGELLQSERSRELERSRRLAIANDPDSVFAPNRPYNGAAPNICASDPTTFGRCNGQNLVLDNGTSLNSPYTFVPDGYLGPAAEGDGGAALLANAGLYDLRAPVDGTQLISPSRATSATVNVRRDLADWLEIFADFYYDRTKSVRTSTLTGQYVLGPNDPNNPFQQTIQISIPIADPLLETRSTNTNLRATGGLIFRLPNRWSGSLEYAWARGKSRTFSDRANVNFADRGLLAQFGTQDVLATRPDFTQFTTPVTVTESGPFINYTNNVSARLAGPLYTLPAGDVTLSLLAEHRDEDIKDSYNQLSATTLILTPAREQRIKSAYGEATLPVFSSANGVPGIHLLDFQASLRYDHYRSTAATSAIPVPDREIEPAPFDYQVNRLDSWDYLIGGRYAPVEGVTFRASYSTGFLPPSVNNFVAITRTLPVTSVAPVSDPMRGGEDLVGDVNGLIEVTSSGNPDLLPEVSKTFSFGLILEPQFLPGLRLSADYTDLHKTDEITVLSLQQLIDLEERFPGRVTRGPNRPGDPAGFAGPIVAYDGSFINAAEARIKAWDFSADYDFDTSSAGHFHLFANFTLQKSLSRAIFEGDALVESAGTASGPVRWAGNVGVDWNKGPWELGWNMQYKDSLGVCLVTDTPTRCDDRIVLQGSGRYEAQTYHDIYGRYTFENDSGALAGLEIGVGIQNVFDSFPDIALTGIQSINLARYADIRGRRFTLTVRKPIRF